MLDARLTGDDARASLRDHPIVETMRATYDPVRLVELTAQLTTEIIGRVDDLYVMAETAAATEPEIATLLADAEQRRLTEGGTIVDVLAAFDVLHPARTIERAKEALWILTSAQPYRLARRRGWSPDEYQHWLRVCMIELLVAPEHRGR